MKKQVMLLKDVNNDQTQGFRGLCNSIWGQKPNHDIITDYWITQSHKNNERSKCSQKQYS